MTASRLPATGPRPARPLRFLAPTFSLLRRHALPLLAALVPLAAAGAEADAGGPPPLDAFARKPAIEQVRLSPDGTHFAALINRGDETLLVTRTVSPGKFVVLARADNKEYSFNWLHWANDERVVFSLRYPYWRKEGGFYDTLETRLLTARADGSGKVTNVTRSAPNDESLRKATRQDQVVDWLPEDGKHVLMQLPETQFSSAPAVFKVDLETGHRVPVHGAQTEVRTWGTDAQHRVRYGVRLSGADLEVIACDPDGANWRTLWRFKVLGKRSVWPLGFGLDPKRLYVLAPHEGLDAVHVVDLDDPALKLKLVYADPRGDLGGQLIRRRDGEVVGISDPHLGDSRSHYWADDFKALAAGIDKALPERLNWLMQVALDGSTYLLWSEGNGVPGQVFVGNRSKGSLALLGEQYPGLDPDRLPRKQELQIVARDGLKLPSLLTLPPGAAPRKLPLVVLPHGGPQSEDTIEFDPWSSFVASRGYAVLQVNFRGSTGHGGALLAAGLKRWGLEMQDDLADGVRHLVDKGIVDPARVCIAGGSYGGYAALMGGIKTPDLYRCVFAFAPVTDLVALSDRAHTYYDEGEILDVQIGDDPAQLRATSPRLQARRMGPPVLLMHGTVDRSVDYAQGEGMAKALSETGRKVRFITLEQGDHHLSNQAHRTQFFRELEGFLLEHLGPGARPAAPDAADDRKAAAAPA